VWVWDSTWLPAVVVRPAQMGFLLVRFEHGVTCTVAISELLPRDIASRGGDRPARSRGFRSDQRRKWSGTELATRENRGGQRSINEYGSRFLIAASMKRFVQFGI
jgi:hypothetical protein